MTFLIPILGARKIFILTIAGQVIMAMIVGHCGLLDLPKDIISTKKVIGATLVIVGVAVSTTD
jgi:transporter family-2 protein